MSIINCSLSCLPKMNFIKRMTSGAQQCMGSIAIFMMMILLSAMCFRLEAQETRGSISGQILDPQGAAIPGAEMLIRNEATGATFTAVSDETGYYRVPQLRPGVYTMIVTHSGFRQSSRSGVVVRVNDRLRIDWNLVVGQVTETVQVVGQAPLLQAEDATAGQVIDNKKIVDLPLNGRNWLQLSTLAPATVTFPGVVEAQGGNSQNVVQNVGGTRWNQTNFVLDGTDNTMFVAGGAIAFPPVDSIQEFKVQSNNYTADTGRLGGAVINATIKSGTNAFHGTAYDFVRNRALNARNFFAAGEKPQFTRNQFGASLGGPGKRDKLFFFFNYEGSRQRQNDISRTTVFSDAEKRGDFSASLGPQIGVDALARPVRTGQIFDPFSVRRLPDGSIVRDPFPGNVIPTDRINPVSRALIDLVPPPNATGALNFIINRSDPLNIDTYLARVDSLVSAKDTIFFHYIHSDSGRKLAPPLALPLDGGGFSLGSEQRKAAVAWTHAFSPTDLNDLRVGYVRNFRKTLHLRQTEDLRAKFGIPMPALPPDLEGLPSIGISGFAGLGPSAGDFVQPVDKYEVSDDYTMMRGSHSLQFGFLAHLKTFRNVRSCFLCRGTLSFNGVFTAQPGFAGTASSVADFLTGVTNSASLGSPYAEKDGGWDLDWYVQDRYVVTPKLTLTFGSRYLLHLPHWEHRDRLVNMTFGPGFTNPELVVPEGMDQATFDLLKIQIPDLPLRRAPELGRGLVHTNYKNIAPRLGLAYRLGTNATLRTGYGIFYGFPDATSFAVLSISAPNLVFIGAQSNSIDPTLFIDQSAFGSDPFRRKLVNPNFLAVMDTNIRPEFIQMYNLILQYQFAPSWLAEIGYVGNRSTGLLTWSNNNDALPAQPADTSSPQSRRKITTDLGDVLYWAPQGYSSYNALFVNVEKRFSAGFSLLANYTWSRALGIQVPLIGSVNSPGFVNPFDFKRNYGPMDFDVIHRGVISYTYELPLGRSKRYLSNTASAVDHLIGGWQISGITTLQGGFPATPTLAFSLGKTFADSRPNLVGDPTASSRQPHDWINRNAFAVPSPAEVAAGNFYGNAGVSSIREPGLVNFDFSIMKNFVLHRDRDLALQFRAEVFNLTNTPFFGRPGALNTNFNSSAFGQILFAGDPRVVQLALKLIL